MLTAGEIASLRDASEELTAPIIAYLLRDLAERIAAAGEFTATAQYETWKLQQLGVSQKEIKKELQKLLKSTNADIERLMTQSAKAGYSFDLKMLPTAEAIPFEDNAAVQQIVAAAVALAQDDLTNITQTLGMIDPYGNAQPLQAAYRQCMDYAFMQVSTGAADYNTAIRAATKNLADKGVYVIDYESGVHTTLEAAVRRNIMGGLGLMQEQISKRNHDDMGADGWEIDAHSNSAPDHEPIQGKQYPDTEYEALNNSLVRRIGTLNCGHSAYPIIMGISSPQYSAEQLEAMREANAEGIAYNGNHYTGYEATQHQRALERAIRKQKRRILIDEATGDAEKLETDQIRLQTLRQEYNRFSKAAGLRTQTERAEVAGFGHKQANAADKAYRNNQSVLEKSTKSGIVKSLDIDDFQMMASGKEIRPEVSDIIGKTIKEFEAKGGIHISAANFGDFYDEASGKSALFQVLPNQYGLVEINVNSRLLSGLTISEADAMIAKTKFNLPNTLREAVAHECGHAKLIHGLKLKEIETLYAELKDIHIDGISPTAFEDGVECIAEIEVLLYRGEKIPKEARELYDKYIGGH